MSDRSLLAGLRSRVEALVSAVRFGQFLSVGAFGAVVDTAVIFVLTEAGVPPLPSKLASAESAILVMFVLNEHWTFDRWGRSTWLALGRRFVTSNMVRAGGVAVATAVLLVLHDVFGLWVVIGNVIGIGAGFAVNYVFESLFTWRVHDPR